MVGLFTFASNSLAVLKYDLVAFKTSCSNAHTLKRKKGIGRKAQPRSPSRELAQAMPRLLYIAVANTTKPAPNMDLMNVFPAIADAAY
jgi:hypothetical protein